MCAKDIHDMVLLVTGCIAPNKSVPVLALCDKDERYEQYLTSLRYYIQHTKIQKIVFCDNSDGVPDTELYRLAEQYHKQFEWLSFQGDEMLSVKFGKGAGECEILEYAIRNSKLFTEKSYMIKVTGRLIVKNIDFLIKSGKRKISLWPNRTCDKRFYINTVVYMMPLSACKKIFDGARIEVDDSRGIYLEHVFARRIASNRIPYTKFMIAPWIDGVSGSTGKRYTTSFISWMKENLKLWVYREPENKG